MKEITIQNLFESQYRPYSNYDNQRSIPNLIDGLKITQRKVLYTCVLKNITKEFKVAQLASSVAFETHYHHGEAGIGGVICNLAKNYVGSNNLNWLEPIGQFGSRLSPIPAAHRYIFTNLSTNFRKYFKKEDDIILEYLYDDENKIEPEFFIPILPGILLNSSEGIGTGFASNILSRNPEDIKRYIRLKLVGKKTDSVQLLPYFDGFKGKVEPILFERGKYQISGTLKRINTTTVKITELPIGMYLDDIKKRLNKLIEGDVIKDYDDNSTEDGFDIDVTMARNTLSSYTDQELLEKFKLTTTITENLTCWLPTKKLRKFNSVEEIIDYFIEFRLNKYSDRISKLISILDDDIRSQEEKICFINFYLKNTTKFKNAGKVELLELLKQNNFSPDLLNMRMWNLTGERIAELDVQLKAMVKERATLLNTKNVDLYKKELESI